MNSPETRFIRAPDGADLCVRRYPLANRPRLVLSHGNGFAMDGYRAFWSLLTDEFEIVLSDLRNHGHSGATPVEAHAISAMAGDHALVAAFCLQAFGARRTCGVFHSVSAIAATLAAAERPLWDGVVLVDPPLVSAASQADIVLSADDRLAAYARNRSAHFPSPEDLATEFAKGAGRFWVEGAALDMAKAVTRPASGGGVELICPGEYEARIYEQNGSTDSLRALGAMQGPVAILGADADAPRALHPARNSKAAARIFGRPYEAVAGASHMLQIEQPGAAAQALRKLLEVVGQG
jgi:pimeloyl-ACP methyl ester carboxylesterase